MSWEVLRGGERALGHASKHGCSWSINQRHWVSADQVNLLAAVPSAGSFPALSSSLRGKDDPTSLQRGCGGSGTFTNSLSLASSGLLEMGWSPTHTPTHTTARRCQSGTRVDMPASDMIWHIDLDGAWKCGREVQGIAAECLDQPTMIKTRPEGRPVRRMLCKPAAEQEPGIVKC